MGHEKRERKKSGPETVWDDLPALYVEFGGQDAFEKLLDELAWSGNWGAQAAAILRNRRDGMTLEQIGDALGVSHVTALIQERLALRTLHDLRDRKLAPMGKGSGQAGRMSIWNNPRGIMRHYSGGKRTYEKRFADLLHRLEGIEAPWSPGWGRRRAKFLRALMEGKGQAEIGEEYDISVSSVHSLGFEALAALEALTQGKEVVPPRIGEGTKIDPSLFTNRYNDPKVFWNLLEEFAWSGEEWHERNQAAEGAAILRARAEGKTHQEIGEVLGTTKQRIEQIEKWALENLDRLSRKEEIEFRARSGRQP